LAHAKQAPLHHLERIGLERGENEKQAIFRCWERTILVHGKPAGSPRFPIKAPRCEMGVKRCLEGRDQLLELVKGQTREIQELCGAGLHIGEP